MVGPSAERREKWDSVVRRIEMQIGRDAGRPVRRNGASFAVAGFETRDAAAQASAAVVKGLTMKFNFEDAKVVVVPEAAADLVLNVERRPAAAADAARLRGRERLPAADLRRPTRRCASSVAAAARRPPA